MEVEYQLARCVMDFFTEFPDFRFQQHGPFSIQSPLENTFSLSNLALVPGAIEQAKKALNGASSEPATAISHARGVLEGTLKWIADQTGNRPLTAMPLPKLFNHVKPFIALGSDASHRLGRGIASMTNDIAEARNLLGDSHGTSTASKGPTRSEARLIVGVALQLAECVLDRYEAKRMQVAD